MAAGRAQTRVGTTAAIVAALTALAAGPAMAQQTPGAVAAPSKMQEAGAALQRGDLDQAIQLYTAALDDSVRLEKLTIRGDTLAAVHAQLIAVRVRCP